MPQHQIFRFRVDRRSLPGWSNPGPADLDTAMGPIDVAETRAADRLATGALDGGKRQRRAGPLRLERFFDEPAHVLGGAHRHGEPAEDVAFEAHGTKRLQMVQRQRLEANVLALQNYGFNFHNLTIKPPR